MTHQRPLNKFNKKFGGSVCSKICVNAVAPGWVDTDMNKGLSQKFIDQQLERIYLKRFASPSEIANVIVFLASEKASFITGSILKVDGGYS